uniref:Aminopeptidase n=1 Tax=Dendroctonus ponderosae TaxID=77166 RepID=A0AAR5QEQ8_DENPD
MSQLLTVFVLLHLTAQEIWTFRLTRTVLPRHYSLKLHPNIDGDHFQGEVSITVSSQMEERRLILHSMNLTITQATVNRQPVEVKEESEQRISLGLQNEERFQPGEHQIRLVFNGTYQDRCGLRKARTEEGVLIVNESEPGYARRIFPCFDEPSFKARFNVRLIAPNATYRALSNMPEIARYSTKAGIIYDFATSVVMSTYLLSLVITDYPFYEEMMKIGDKTIPVRIFTSKASKEKNGAAVQAVKFYMNYYTEYTGIPCPLPKLDFIEYEKKKSPATETWGLVQFNWGYLSYNQNSTLYGLYVTSMAHELSHFWFGNLVTNDWWSDLWIQESFASFISKKSTSRRNLIKEMTLTGAIRFEDQSTMRQMVVPLNNTQDTQDRFNQVVYRKGSYLLRSLERLIGEEAFQEISKEYLKKHLFKTATTNDVIEAFEEKLPNINIRSFLESFLFQEGCPIINVNDSGDGLYTLEQVSGSSKDSKWTVPVSYRLGNGSRGLIWFDRDLESVEIEIRNLSDWILFNTHQTPGLYLVNYTERMWLNLVRNIDTIPLRERSKLGDNLYLLYIGKYINCDLIFTIINKNSQMLLDWMMDVIAEIVTRTMCFPIQYAILKDLIEGRFGDYQLAQADYSDLCPSDGAPEITDAHQAYCLRWMTRNLIKPDIAVNGTQ